MHFEFTANFIFLDQGANIFSLTDSRGAAAAATTVNSSWNDDVVALCTTMYVDSLKMWRKRMNNVYLPKKEVKYAYIKYNILTIIAFN